MLGLVNQNSLSAVSLATQIQFVLNLFYAALTIGATILAAQYWGKGDREAVEQILAVALRISISVSLAFFLAAAFFPALLMRIFTRETELINMGASYLRIAGWSFLCTGVSQIYLCIMKNSGKAVRSTLYSSVSVLLNILLNGVLIFGLFGAPRLEIQGAALATLISRAAELIFVAAEHVKKDTIRIRRNLLLLGPLPLTKDFLRYTSPVMANELVWGCGFTMFTIIMGHLGNDAVAANSIANIVKNLIACMCLGIGTGSGIMVGNELGRKNLALAREYGEKLCRISLWAGLLSGALLLACTPVILSFSGGLSSQARHYLQSMLYICSYYLIGKSVNSTVIAGIFCAGGDTKFGFFCDIITMWLIIVLLAFQRLFIQASCVSCILSAESG